MWKARVRVFTPGSDVGYPLQILTLLARYWGISPRLVSNVGQFWNTHKRGAWPSLLRTFSHFPECGRPLKVGTDKAVAPRGLSCLRSTEKKPHPQGCSDIHRCPHVLQRARHTPPRPPGDPLYKGAASLAAFAIKSAGALISFNPLDDRFLRQAPGWSPLCRSRGAHVPLGSTPDKELRLLATSAVVIVVSPQRPLAT